MPLPLMEKLKVGLHRNRDLGPKPDCIERNALHQRCIFSIHPCTALRHTELAWRRERKNVWLGLTAVKLAEEVGFVLPPAFPGKCLLTVPPKGRANPHCYVPTTHYYVDPFACTSAFHGLCCSSRKIQKLPPKWQKNHILSEWSPYRSKLGLEITQKKLLTKHAGPVSSGPICIQHTKHSDANIFKLSSQILARFQKVKQLTTNICQLSSEICTKVSTIKKWQLLLSHKCVSQPKEIWMLHRFSNFSSDDPSNSIVFMKVDKRLYSHCCDKS